ncbi:hypothetical protein [Methylobacterium sp. J-076]|uniref:hypothetical protein n=1 Tax=Methylobacterium sp. J-076 TaxID=2836655 RepID=UPI001FBB102D|nr:hypothetical protein [Methylobacterium sp. J-076]MCJ2015208.1 hypothetical protein [Methylobacterium sp. J-076]
MIQQEYVAIALSRPIRETTVSKIQPSDEFKQYGRMFIQDLYLLGDSFEEIIDRITKNYDGIKRAKLLNFIDKILESNLTHQELQRLWSATDSDIYFRSAEGFKDFLRMTRDRL